MLSRANKKTRSPRGAESKIHGEHVQIILKSLFVAVIFAIGTGSSLAANPALGTWKLNIAKSTFSPGPAPKSQTRRYAEGSRGITLTIKTTAADGKESVATLTFEEDGKPYPVSGNPDFDMVAVSRAGPLGVHSTQTKGGAVVGSGNRIVSKDGHTLTFKQKGTHADGTKYDHVSVYDRQ